MTLPLPAPQDYTDRDFAATLIRLNTLMAAAFPSWDSERSRFENVVVQADAWMHDYINFYLDQMARETRFGTAQLRKSMIELCRLIGYTLDTQTAALTDVVFSIPVITAGNVTIPAGTTVKTLGVGTQVVRYQTLALATIVAGGLSSAAVGAENSTARSDSFTATGEISEPFKLTSRPFIDGTDSILIAGAPWTRVSHFLDSGSADTHYTIRVDEFDYATIRLGNGVNGSPANAGDPVVVSYKTGGGADGQVGANALKKVEGGPWYDGLGNQVSLSCDNAVAAVGGTDRETVDQARVRAPRSLRVLNRCVARTDFEDLAIQVTGVARALALSKNEDATIAEGFVQVWIVPEGGGAAPGALLTAVETYINTNYPTTVITSWHAYAAPYVTINIVAYAYLEQGAVAATVGAAVRAALVALFSEQTSDGDPNEQVKFGYYYLDSTGVYDGQFPLSLIADTIMSVAGIRRLGTPADGEGITANAAQDDVTLLAREFPVAGTLQLINGDTALDIYNGPIA